MKERLAFSVTGPNGEAIATDMPAAVGGGGGVPQPGWLLRAALASCIGTVIALRAAKLGIDLTVLDVTVESASDHRGMLGLDDTVSAALANLRARVRIAAGTATPAELEALVRWGDAHSPVSCTLRHALGTTPEVVVL